MSDEPFQFEKAFEKLTGHRPMPWQERLFDLFVKGDFSHPLSLPTGLGKTTVIPIWLLALAKSPKVVPRRLVYVVNRRTIVDQATREAEKLRKKLAAYPVLRDLLKALCAIEQDVPLAISTLRGEFADNGEWCADPARPAIIIGTVDMIGSRLLFSGYGIGIRRKPFHAGLLGQDSLIIHDEAHLEPAFQALLDRIVQEQTASRCPDFKPFKVMALSATSRHNSQFGEATKDDCDKAVATADVFELDEEDLSHPIVRERLNSDKGLKIEPVADEKKTLRNRIVALALEHRDTDQAILIFVHRVEDVLEIEKELKKNKIAEAQIAVLTGTIRGLERDRLATKNDVFQRFLPESTRSNCKGAVYLICTSAGEVGVDISGDHLVCDLTPLDSMAQRCGRVNRYGHGKARIDVVYAAGKNNGSKYEQARTKTHELLQKLPQIDNRHVATPQALGELIRGLSDADRASAFTPPPAILEATDIHFDAWALTTIRDKLPSRPQVEPYLHGIADWEPAETHVAWREEIKALEKLPEEMGIPGFMRYAEELLDDYPLKPHELLHDRTDRVHGELVKVRDRAGAESPVWLVDADGSVQVGTLGTLLDGDPKSAMAALANRTVLLPTSAGGLDTLGMLNGDSASANDVADDWFEENKPDGNEQDNRRRRRIRAWEDDPALNEKRRGMRLIRTIDVKPDNEDRDQDDDEAETRRFWHWYELPRSADNEGSEHAREAVKLVAHIGDVEARMEAILAALAELPESLKAALRLASKYHDVGKNRDLWQLAIGNADRDSPLAKSGKATGRSRRIDYRHEFGSLREAREQQEVAAIDENARELALHVIAAHHGRARPHVPSYEAYDPQATVAVSQAIAVEVPQRFARLQREYGRWGLAYLESLLRAADYAASANPTMESASEEA